MGTPSPSHPRPNPASPPQPPPVGAVPLVVGWLLTYVRYGSAHTLSSPADPAEVRTLSAPARGALRALATQSGGIALLLTPRAASSGGAFSFGGLARADGAAATAPLDGSRGGAKAPEGPRLVVCGARPAVRRARTLLAAWRAHARAAPA